MIQTCARGRSWFLILALTLHAMGAMTNDASTPQRLYQTTPVEVEVWSWVVDIYDVDYKNQQLALDVYLTFCFTNGAAPEITPLENLEILNAKRTSIRGVSKTQTAGFCVQSCKCITTLKADWDTRAFPFDSHVVQLVMEDYKNTVSNQLYITEPTSGMDATVHTPHWRIVSCASFTNAHEWGWGDVYSQYVISITMRRDNPWALFFKTFFGLFIAMLIAFLSLHVQPTDVDPRFGLPLGAIFAAVGSHYVANAYLPDTSRFSFVDQVHNVSYLYILFCFIVSTLSLRFIHRDKLAKATVLDRHAAWLLPLSYMLIVAMMVTLQ